MILVSIKIESIYRPQGTYKPHLICLEEVIGMESFWRISDFAKEIGKHPNTVDGWFKQLEEKQIHYVNRTENGEKLYDELDLSIAQFITQQRANKWALDVIYDSLSHKFDLRSVPIEETSMSTTYGTSGVDLEQFKDEILKAAKEIAASHVQEVKQQYETIIKKLPEPKTKEEERADRMDTIIIRRRVESSLRAEAIKVWNQKPEEERVKRLGFFWKEEDWGKRDEFINQYINERFEERIRESYIK
jgi:DNA-binding transcriptional MerR regulator